MKMVVLNLSALMDLNNVLTIEELYKLTGIDLEILEHLYNQNQQFQPKLESLVQLCQFFRCELSDLITYTPVNNKN